MSEEIRSRLYAWLCEQTDEPQAEYLMSCLAPAPLSDLVTRDFLSAEVAGLDARIGRLDVRIARLEGRIVALETKVDLLEGRIVALETRIVALETKVDLLVAQRAEDKAEHAAQRAEDQAAAQQRHWWLVGTVVSAAFAIGAPVWLGAFGVIGG